MQIVKNTTILFDPLNIGKKRGVYTKKKDDTNHSHRPLKE